MKRNIFAIFLALALTAGCLSVTASAAESGNQTAGQTTVNYSLHGQYSISIPESVSISDGSPLQISADYLHLIDGESVVVSVAEESFQPDNIRFPLTDGNGNALYCEIHVNKAGAPETEARSIYQTDALTSPVITYTPDNLDDIAVMQIIPNVERDSVAGSYSGILYFDITLKTE